MNTDRITITRNIVSRATIMDTICRIFEAVDGKGRKLGAKAWVIEADRTIETTHDNMWYCTQMEVFPAGHVFGYRGQATRNGENFGATQIDNWFMTAEERDADMARYFKGAEKRATKNAGK